MTDNKPGEPDAAMVATAAEDDDPRELTGEIVPGDELRFDEDVEVLASDLLLDEEPA